MPYVPPKVAVHQCPECKRYMSTREAAEQGACNDCHPGGAYSPDGLYPNYND